VFCITGFAGYFALLAMAARNDDSLLSWLANSLGLLYGTLLFITGLASICIACRSTRRSVERQSVASAIPFVFLPAYIGIIGCVHGYIHIYHILLMTGTTIKQSHMFFAYHTALVSFLVGLVLSFIPFAILCVTLILKSDSRQSPSSVTHSRRKSAAEE